MIITAHTGQGFGGVLAYVYKEGKGLSEEEKPIILEQNNLFGTTKQQAQLMRGVAMENSKSSRPVLHLTMSYPIDEKPSKKEVDEHLKAIIKEIGATAENNQYVIVAHRDSVKDVENKEEHYHIVINKVGFNGKNINTSYIQNKVHVIADKLEKQFDLEKTIGRKIVYDSSPENEKGWRYTTKTERATAVLKAKKEGKKVVVADKRPDIKIAKVAIADKVKQALLTSTNPQELSSKLAEHGITIGVSVDKENNNAIRGISFKSDEIKVGGKEIGYSWQTINDTFHVNQAKSLEKTMVAQPVSKNKFKALHGEMWDIIREEQKSKEIISIPTVSASVKQPLKDEQKAVEPTLNPISAIAPVQKVKENRAEKELGQNIAQIGKEVLQTAKSLPEFEYKLSVRGITIETLENSTGTYGIKFTQNGNSFKGSEIGLKIKEIEQKIQTNLDQAIAPGATPIPTPTVEPFRKKEEPLVHKKLNHEPFEWTLSEKEKSEKAHIPKANADLKKAIESYPRKHIDLVKHLQETNTIQERGNELVISTENNEVSTLNKEYLKGLQPKLNEKYWKWDKEMKAYKELISTPIKHGGWFEKDKDKQERERKNKEIESAVEPPLILLTEEDKKEMMKALEIPNPYIEREEVYKRERADFNSEVRSHNRRINEIKEEKEEKRNIALDDDEEKPKQYKAQGL